jgi:hypothetical protein
VNLKVVQVLFTVTGENPFESNTHVNQNEVRVHALKAYGARIYVHP